MSLTVTCRDCRIPDRPRQIVQWRVGSCKECCDDFISKHLLEHPDHRIEVSGHTSETSFVDVPQRIERLFGRKTA